MFDIKFGEIGHVQSITTGRYKFSVGSSAGSGTAGSACCPKGALFLLNTGASRISFAGFVLSTFCAPLRAEFEFTSIVSRYSAALYP
jgi:hypothetical protein